MSRQTFFADVLLPLALTNYYTYRIPNEWNDQIFPGQRVVVQFGKSKFYTALVRRIHQNPPADYTAKYIEEIADHSPIIKEWQFEFWEWIAQYYLCFPGEVMQAALPSGLKLHSESKIALSNEVEWDSFDLSIHSKNEQILIETLHSRNVITLKDVSELLRIKNVQGIIKTLLEKNIISTFEEIRDKYTPKKVTFLSIHESELNSEANFEKLISDLEKRAFKQLEVLLEYLNLQKGFLALKEKSEEERWVEKLILTKKFSESAVNALIKKNVFKSKEFEVSRINKHEASLQQFELSTMQTKALEEIQSSFSNLEVCLLHGITGSGKTEIYIKLIEEQFAKGNSVLYLIPEIALTTQLIHRMQLYFGKKVCVYHSRFSENERVEIWNRILNDSDSPNLIIGARSSLFLPFDKLGLIIVDEEHDSSFKQQDPAPRYNARDAAIYLGKKRGAKILLGSATPSFESYQNCKEKKYGKVELFVRYGEAELPETIIANLRNDETRKFTAIGQVLKEAIQRSLEKKSQVILFQNRRGFAPYTQCEVCAWIPSCENCDVSLIYHKSKQQFNCHYCGSSFAPISICKACGSNDLRFKGYGTEKIEEEIEILFPTAKILRMDLDSTRSKHSYRQIIDEFSSGKVDILVGTQMVTKGLHFDNVSLVGVLNADSLLNFPEFRAFEKAFQLLTQVSGRAGRKSTRGKVVIQTEKPDHPVLTWVKQNNYFEFYNSLILTRKQFDYPPFFRITEFYFKSKDQNELLEAAKWFTEELGKLKVGQVLGPEFPLIARVKNEFIMKTILKVNKE